MAAGGREWPGEFRGCAQAGRENRGRAALLRAPVTQTVAMKNWADRAA